MADRRPASGGKGKRALASAAACALAGILSLHGAPLGEREDFIAAGVALSEGLPDLAAARLSRLLDESASLESGEVAAIKVLRLEALARAGDPAALEAGADPTLAEKPAAAFWHGIALARAGRPGEALQRLAPLETGAGEAAAAWTHELALNLAALRHATGDSAAALETLERAASQAADVRERERVILLAARIKMESGDHEAAWSRLDDPGDPETGGVPDWTRLERDLLRARIALRRGTPDEASARFSSVARAVEGSSLASRALLGLAESRVAAGAPRHASEILAGFIEDQPDSPLLEEAFHRLDSLGLLAQPAVVEKLAAWSADESHPHRQALALCHRALAARQRGEPAEALAALDEFLARFPRHPHRETALLDRAETLLESEQDEAAGQAIAEIARLADAASSPRLHLEALQLEARRRLERGEPEQAAARFREAVDAAPDDLLATASAFNAALAAIQRGDEEAYQQHAALVELTPFRQLPGDLMFERGILEAGGGSPAAFDSLEAFLRRHPAHPRAADAEIALAELYLNQVPAQPVSAREHLDSAQERILSPTQREWLHYVAIWVEAARQDVEAAAAGAARFLDAWPRSSRRPSVHMALGENLFRSGDNPGAARAFEALAEESPDSGFAEAALFFAARAASLTRDREDQRRAMDLWGRVTAGGGPLSAAARHEQGLLRLDQEEYADAVTAFESVAAMPAAAPALRIAAVGDKGETLFAQAASLGPASAAPLLEAAAAAFAEVRIHPSATRAWRLQAAARQGKCLERLGREEEAMALYLAIIREGAALGLAPSAPLAEHDWFFRAGLAAARLLQAADDWEGAVAVADTVAQAGGPRSAEAARIADEIRLRHFIWQDPGQ